MENQYDWQSRNPKSVMLVFDPLRTSLEGTAGVRSLALRAYHLSAEFMALYKGGQFTTDKIRQCGVKFGEIFVELPISVRPAFPAALSALFDRVRADPTLAAESSLLDTTVSPIMEGSLEALSTALDAVVTDQTTKYRIYQRDVRQAQRSGAPIPTEPSQLDHILLLARAQSLCNQIADAASESSEKIAFVRSLSSPDNKESC